MTVVGETFTQGTPEAPRRVRTQGRVGRLTSGVGLRPVGRVVVVGRAPSVVG